MADIQLPHKLSELAQIALDDVMAIEQLPEQYVVDMDEFIGRHGGLCSVCAAGAVMVQHLGATPQSTTADFGQQNKLALWAIDKLRMGRVGWAQQILDLGLERIGWHAVPDHRLDREVPEYSPDDESWHGAMAQLIADLRGAGL